MRACCLALLATLALAAPAAAKSPLRLQERAALGQRLEELTFATPALRAPTKVRVLLPAGYRRSGGKRYPVLLLLHGAGGDYRSWTTSGEAEEITRGLPLIVVMPDGGRGGWYTDWFNNGAFGPPKWETYHLRQLLPWIESRYRAVGARRGRAVAGLSMGGWGTMSYAARHPDLFSSAAAFSGAVDANVPPGIGEAIVNATAAADGGRPGDVAGPRATEDVRWRGHNPWDLAANLEGMRLALRTGNGDPGGPFDTGTGTDPIEQFVHAENVSLHERLERHGIEHVWDDYGPGYHRWPYWNRALRQTLPAMMAAFRRPRPPLSPYTYRSIEPRYEVFGWRVSLRRRALEFSSLRLDDLRAPALSGSRSFVLSGSGSATVVTPARFASGRTYRVVARGTRSGARRRDLKARGGRLRIPIQLGPANRTQERFSADGEPTAATKVFLTRVRIRALGL